MSKNDITGDRLVSRANTEAYDKNFEQIFNKNKCSECGYTFDKVHLKRHEASCSKAEIGQDFGAPWDIFGGGYPNGRGDRGI